MTDPQQPPADYWAIIDSVLRHERELWDAGIDAPSWYSRPQSGHEDAGG